MEWVQVYDPLGWPLVSALVAALPIVLLLGLLVCGWSAPRAAGVGLGTALAVAVLFFGMPASAALAAAGYGACFGLLPIGWIVLAAVFLFHLTVRAGQFEVLKRSVSAISPDRRMQALLIAFSFGAFLEGAAGFGTPVAISAALMIGIGFSPLYAAGLALLANTAPVAFGALGTPIITLAKVSGLDEMALSQMAGRQLPLFSLLIPAWLVALMSRLEGREGLLAGDPRLRRQLRRDPVRDGQLPRSHAGRRVRRRRVAGGHGRFSPRLAAQAALAIPRRARAASPNPTCRRFAREVAYAWMPWVFLSVMVFLWGWPSLKTTLDGGKPERPNCLRGISKLSFDVPWLNHRIFRTAPVVPVPSGSDRAAEPEVARYDLSWLATTGTGIFLAAVLSAFWLRIGWWAFWQEFARTLFRVRWALLTIACMLALAFATRYSGADATLGIAFTKTGWFYPFFAPLLGWLGVALTGSDTSCNALFGSLQRITAEQLGLNPVLIVASNSTGGVMGKMIDAQSIVVAAVATGQTGSEGQILRFVFGHSLVLACMVGLLTWAQAYLLPWMIPAG